VDGPPWASLRCGPLGSRRSCSEHAENTLPRGRETQASEGHIKREYFGVIVCPVVALVQGAAGRRFAAILSRFIGLVNVHVCERVRYRRAC
jgi:hypothetical protein